MQEIRIKLENENKIIEKQYELTIGDSKAANLITEDINGYLECIFMDIDKPCDLTIGYENYDNILIFKSKTGNLMGQKMFIPRIQATHNDDEGFNYSQERYSLNNKLRIEAFGQPNTNIKISIRYVEG